MKKLAEFARNAIESGWVDAEPKEDKPPGGFCAPFSVKKNHESLCVMTEVSIV